MSSLLYVPTDANRVLDAVWVTLPRGRSADRVNAHDVRVGIADSAGKVTTLATYTGSRQSIPASGLLRLTPAARLRRAIPSDGSVMAEVATYGSPVLAAPLGVQLLVGSAAEVPAFRLGESPQKDAADALVEHVMAVGAGDQVVARDLVDPLPFADDARHDAAVTISSTSFTNGNVSVTVPVPFGCAAKVKATAFCTFVSTSGAAGSLLYAAIGDGTTDHNFESQTTGVATALLFDHIGVTFAGTITRTTTYTLRLAVDVGAATASVTNQTLSVMAVPV